MRLSKAIFLFLIGIMVAQTAYYFPILPETVASHYNAQGIADSWLPKESFLIFEAVILTVVIAHFSVLPILLEKSPDKFINLPNKKYWLAPERRVQTFLQLRRYFEWFSIGLLSLFVLINQQVFKANLMHQNLSPLVLWLIIGGFVIFSIFWMIKFVRQFKINI